MRLSLHSRITLSHRYDCLMSTSYIFTQHRISLDIHLYNTYYSLLFPSLTLQVCLLLSLDLIDSYNLYNNIMYLLTCVQGVYTVQLNMRCKAFHPASMQHILSLCMYVCLPLRLEGLRFLNFPFFIVGR